MLRRATALTVLWLVAFVGAQTFVVAVGSGQSPPHPVDMELYQLSVTGSNVASQPLGYFNNSFLNSFAMDGDFVYSISEQTPYTLNTVSLTRKSSLAPLPITGLGKYNLDANIVFYDGQLFVLGFEYSSDGVSHAILSVDVSNGQAKVFGMVPTLDAAMPEYYVYRGYYLFLNGTYLCAYFPGAAHPPPHSGTSSSSGSGHSSSGSGAAPMPASSSPWAATLLVYNATSGKFLRHMPIGRLEPNVGMAVLPSGLTYGVTAIAYNVPSSSSSKSVSSPRAVMIDGGWGTSSSTPKTPGLELFVYTVNMTAGNVTQVAYRAKMPHAEIDWLPDVPVLAATASLLYFPILTTEGTMRLTTLSAKNGSYVGVTEPVTGLPKFSHVYGFFTMAE